MSAFLEQTIDRCSEIVEQVLEIRWMEKGEI